MERYLLLDSLLFKNCYNPRKRDSIVSYTGNMHGQNKITLYHSSLFAGHEGVIKTYLTIRDKLFIPSLIHYLHPYIKGCHI